MKITIYELLGLVKDGKAPKKIKFCGNIYEWEDDWYLTKEKNYKVCLGGKKGDVNVLMNAFNENVEIIEEDENIEELKIEQDGNTYYIKNEYGTKCYLTKHSYLIADKVDELVREINKLKGKNKYE